MKRMILAFLCLASVLQLSAQKRDWAQFDRYAEANKTAQHGAKAVFMGNSITEGWYAVNKDFFTENNYLGRGISGQVTAQMLARFRADVVDLQPRSVVILAGTNDIAENNGHVSVQHIFDNIVSMAEIAKANKIKVILCSVLPAHTYRWRPEINSIEPIAELNAMLAAYAKANKIPYVDFYSAMVDERKGLPEKLSGDGVHPTKEGYDIMEAIVKPVIDKYAK